MRERKPGSEPQSGDRVPYLLINTGDPKRKRTRRAKTPRTSRRRSYRSTTTITHKQVFRPVCDLVEPLVDNPKVEIFGEIIESHKPQKKNKKKKDPPLDRPRSIHGLKTTQTYLVRRNEMSNVDTTIDSVRELILNHGGRGRSRRARVHTYPPWPNRSQHELSHVARPTDPGASIKTTCLGVNRKTGKGVRTSRVATQGTASVTYHSINFAALSGGGEMMVRARRQETKDYPYRARFQR